MSDARILAIYTADGKFMINWNGLVPIGAFFILAGIGMVLIGLFLIKLRAGGI